MARGVRQSCAMGCGNSKTSEVVVPHPGGAAIEQPVKAPAKAAPAAPAKSAPPPPTGALPPPKAALSATVAPGKATAGPVPSVNLGRVVGGNAPGAPGAYFFSPRATPTPRFIPFQANPTEYGSKVFLGQVAQQVRRHGIGC